MKPFVRLERPRFPNLLAVVIEDVRFNHGLTATERAYLATGHFFRDSLRHFKRLKTFWVAGKKIICHCIHSHDQKATRRSHAILLIPQFQQCARNVHLYLLAIRSLISSACSMRKRVRGETISISGSFALGTNMSPPRSMSSKNFAVGSNALNWTGVEKARSMVVRGFPSLSYFRQRKAGTITSGNHSLSSSLRPASSSSS